MALFAASHFALGQVYLATLIVFFVLCVIQIKQHVSFGRKYRFPNLVKGLPIIGNTLQMPPNGQGPHLQKLAEKYGEMYFNTSTVTAALLM